MEVFSRMRVGGSGETQYRKTCPGAVGRGNHGNQHACIPPSKKHSHMSPPQKNSNKKTIATKNQTSFSMGKEHHQSLVFGLDSNPVKENLILSQGNPDGNDASLRAYFSL